MSLESGEGCSGGTHDVSVDELPTPMVSGCTAATGVILAPVKAQISGEAERSSGVWG